VKDKLKLDVKVTIRMPGMLVNILEGEARFLKVTLSAHIRSILGQYIEEVK